MNRDQSIIASICYFSVFFMPFIVPIVAYFVVDQKETKRHSARALWSHVLPVAKVCAAGFWSYPLFIDDTGKRLTRSSVHCTYLVLFSRHWLFDLCHLEYHSRY